MRQVEPSQERPRFSGRDAARRLDPLLLIEARFFDARPFETDLGRYSVLCVHRGSALVEFPNSKVRVNEGELLLLGGRDSERVAVWQGQATESAVLSFCGDAVVADSSLAEVTDCLRDFEGLTSGTPIVISASREAIEEILEFMRRIGSESECRGKHSSLAMKTYLRMILILLCRQKREGANEPTVQARDAARLQPLFLYIDQHYMEAIPVDEAAQVVNMSNSHFMRYFRQATGSAFVPYLNRIRITKAQALIRQSKLSITQVGEAVGFCDHSYFSSVFRRFSGIGPREYRNQLRKPAA